MMRKAWRVCVSVVWCSGIRRVFCRKVSVFVTNGNARAREVRPKTAMNVKKYCGALLYQQQCRKTYQYRYRKTGERAY